MEEEAKSSAVERDTLVRERQDVIAERDAAQERSRVLRASLETANGSEAAQVGPPKFAFALIPCLFWPVGECVFAQLAVRARWLCSVQRLQSWRLGCCTLSIKCKVNH